MNKVERAIKTFKKGYNCTQSILSTYAPQYDLDLLDSLRIGAAFGGGIARTGRTCGAVTGALMVIGLEYGMIDLERKETKIKTYEVSNDFIKKFMKKNKSILCKDLIGCDLTTPSARVIAKEKGVFNLICPNLIKNTVEILEELLEKE